ASDFKPAFTTTKLWSTRTTSAVMTSPDFISWRWMLSSNRAAKLSSPARFWETEDMDNYRVTHFMGADETFGLKPSQSVESNNLFRGPTANTGSKYLCQSFNSKKETLGPWALGPFQP